MDKVKSIMRENSDAVSYCQVISTEMLSWEERLLLTFVTVWLGGAENRCADERLQRTILRHGLCQREEQVG